MFLQGAMYLEGEFSRGSNPIMCGYSNLIGALRQKKRSSTEDSFRGQGFAGQSGQKTIARQQCQLMINREVYANNRIKALPEEEL